MQWDNPRLAWHFQNQNPGTDDGGVAVNCLYVFCTLNIQAFQDLPCKSQWLLKYNKSKFFMELPLTILFHLSREWQHYLGSTW